MSAEALVAKNITKRYNKFTALENIDMVVPEQSIYGLLGPNGAGKTTLIRIINQIINSDEGVITLFGEKLHPNHIGLIGYLPEERGLYKKLKVGEQLIYLARLKGLSKKEAMSKINDWLLKFEIQSWWNSKVEDLSKGMAQKIQFISTVMHNPKLLILDEPFSGFDPINSQLITNEIINLKNNGCTIILSTHRMETVEDLCDHIALIDKSKKIYEGSKKQVKEKFITDTVTLTHRGEFVLTDNINEIIKQERLDNNTYQTSIKMSPEVAINHLLRELTEVTEVYSFAKKTLTMSEIFIELVKKNKNE